MYPRDAKAAGTAQDQALRSTFRIQYGENGKMIARKAKSIS